MEGNVFEAKERNIWWRIYENLPIMVFIMDIEGRVCMVNERSVKDLGYPKDQLIGQSVLKVFYEKDKERVLEQFKNCLEAPEGTLLKWRFRKVTYDGRVIWVGESVSKIQVEGKTFVVVVCDEITKFVESEEELYWEKKKFQALSDKSPLGVAILGKDGRYLYVNPRFTEITGFSLSEVSDKRKWFISVYLDSDYREKAMSEWAKHVSILKPGESIVREFVITIKRGEKRNIKFTVVALEKGYFKKAKYLVFHEDVTDRRKAETVISESEERYRLLFEKSSDGHLLIETENNTYIKCNEAALYMMEVNDESFIIGKHPSETCPLKQPNGLSSREEADKYIREAIERGHVRFEWTKRMLSGKSIIIDATLTSIKDKGETLVYAVWRDLSPIKEMEKQLLHSQKMKAVGTLAGGIAHDFNNILTAIIGYGSLAKIKVADCSDHSSFKKEVDSYLGKIIENGTRAGDLTKQLLAFSRKDTLEVRTFNVVSLVKELKKILQEGIGENIQLNVFNPYENINIKADPARIEQVIVNLVTNASHAIPNDREGRINVTFERVVIGSEEVEKISGAREGEFVCMSVSDNGDGIEEENLGKIFDPFFTTKDVNKGTGLGLSLVYGVIKQHNGFIQVESKVGEGSIFRIFLESDRATAETSDSKKKISLLDKFKGNNERILVVEDDKGVMGFTLELLRGRGYKIFDAENTEEAIFLLEKEGDVDLIVSDVVLPGRSGISLADEISDQGSGTKFLLMSGFPDEKARPDEIRAKGYNFITKPFSPKDFLEKIGEILRS